MYVFPSGDTNNQSVINHNPLPDIPHEEFVSLMGPLLVPEHYPSPESPLASPPLSPPPLSPNIGAPFEWIHFEGRSVKTTLSNIKGLDGLARERRWRSQCVFSVDVGRRARQGIEAVRALLIPIALSNSLIYAAHPPRRRALPQPTLRASTIPRVRQRPACLPTCPNAPRPAARAAHRLLGRRRRRSALRPNTRVLPILRLVSTHTAHRQHFLSLLLPLHYHHPIHNNTTSPPAERA
jgi:hypothetical protein